MSKYQLQGELGRGAMGIVYRATQDPLGREVAVKFLNPGTMASPQMRLRFLREIQACIELSHTNIIKILDYGEQNDQLYYVMELIDDAVPLDKLLKKEGSIRKSRAAKLMDQLLDALDYVHAHRFIHRDLKPANLMLRPEDRLILMDFGLVKPVERTVLTREGALVGTPRYISPEVLRGISPASPSSDVFAAGSILYEMLTGSFAFDGASLQDVLRAILAADPVPPTRLRPGLHPQTDELLDRFLAKEPSQRFGSAAEAREAVARWASLPADSAPFKAHAVPPVARGAAVGASRPSGRITAPASRSRPTPVIVPPAQPQPSRRAGPFALLGVVAIGLACMYRLWSPVSRSRAAAAASGTPVAPIGAPTARVAVAGVDADWGATCVTARWTSDTDELAELSVLSGVSQAAPPASEKTAVRDHAIRIEGLRPDTAYTLVGRAGDHELFRVQGRTASVLDAAARLQVALTRLAPWSHLRALRADRSLRHNAASTAETSRREAAVARLKGELARAYDRARVAASVAAFEGVRDLFFGSRDVALDSKVALYRSIALTRELEWLAATHGLGVPNLADRVASPFYGASPAERLVRPRVVVAQLEKHTFDPYKSGTEQCTVLLDPEELNRLTTFVELREAPFEPQSDARDSADPELPSYTFPSTLPLPRAAQVRDAEIHVHLSGALSVNLTIFLASPDGKWRAIAQIQARPLHGSVDLWHGLDPRLLSGPARMRIDLIRGDDRGIAEEIIHLAFVAFRWTDASTSGATR